MEKSEIKSKTQRKKEAHHLQRLGERLLQLSPKQLHEIDMPEELLTAVTFTKTITSHGARKRETQRIGAIMRRIDPTPVLDALQRIDMGEYQKARAFKQIELWRDELIEGNDRLIEEILRKCPDAERRQLAQLIRNAIKAKQSPKAAKTSRALFRYLRTIYSEAESD